MVSTSKIAGCAGSVKQDDFKSGRQSVSNLSRPTRYLIGQPICAP